MLSIDSVDVCFGNNQILSGCFLQCSKGEIVGVLGRNGAGKSTLLKVIFGLCKARFKHLRIDNKIIDSGYLSRQVAYLPQESFLPPFLKVSAVLNKATPDAGEWPALFKDLLSTRVAALSSGEKRILECYYTLSLHSPYILLDEPFSGLSPLHVSLIQDLIISKRIGKGIILTDHLYRPLKDVSDRIVLIHNNSNYDISSEEELVRYEYLPSLLA